MNPTTYNKIYEAKTEKPKIGKNRRHQHPTFNNVYIAQPYKR